LPAIITLFVFPPISLYALLLRVMRKDFSHATKPWNLTLGGMLFVTALAWTTPFVCSPLFIGRHAGARACAQKGDAILQALARYQADNQTYPEDLHMLVPKYLPAIPMAGALAYSDWHYQRGSETAPFEGFELSLPMLYGMSGDRLFYWPSEKYPDFIYSGRVVRLGSWAYTHE
jgi:hypothetical protein